MTTAAKGHSMQTMNAPTERTLPDVTNCVVAATDGSRAGGLAVRWAAREADRSARPLRIVSVRALGRVLSPSPMSALGLAQAYASAMDDVPRQAVSAAVDERANVDAEAHVVDGDPVRVLSELSGEADLLVVGSTGRGGAAGTLFGSVADGVIAAAQGPVTVVRDGPLTTAWDAPVVVATDLSDSAEAAVDWAFTLAEEQDRDLVVLHVLTHDTSFDAVRYPRGESARANWPDNVSLALEASTLAFRHAHPSVRVDHRVVTAPAADDVILVETMDAAHLVVGSRGRRRVLGTLFGSLSRQVSRASECPVTVVPAGGSV